MKDSVKIGAAVIVGAGLIAWLKKKAKSGITGIGATHTTITGEVVGVEWRNRDINGNSSYWVYIKRDTGQFIKAYTAHGSALGYQINRMIGQVVTFDVTIRKSGQIVLHNTWRHEYELHKK